MYCIILQLKLLKVVLINLKTPLCLIGNWHTLLRKFRKYFVMTSAIFSGTIMYVPGLSIQDQIVEEK